MAIGLTALMPPRNKLPVATGTISSLPVAPTGLHPDPSIGSTVALRTLPMSNSRK